MQILFSNYVWGAGVATDLVNTSARVRSQGDAIVDPEGLADFLARHDVRTPAGSAPTAGDVEAVHRLRDEVRGILELTDTESVIARSTELSARSSSGPTLVRDPRENWQWCVVTSPSATIADELAALMGLGLLAVVQSLDHGRFRHCESPVCDGMFVDTSRAGRRRYCMPELCGNRVNVANYRSRRGRQ